MLTVLGSCCTTPFVPTIIQLYHSLGFIMWSSDDICYIQRNLFPFHQQGRFKGLSCTHLAKRTLCENSTFLRLFREPTLTPDHKLKLFCSLLKNVSKMSLGTSLILLYYGV